MRPEFWHDKWEHNEIGFHQESINQYLCEHWSQLGLAGDETVFVPLCGKSQDLLWIQRKGHPVLGVEISQIACRAFFAESGLEPEVTTEGAFTCYRRESISVLCGDFFALTQDHVSEVGAVYDRAALIALPAEMRARYTEHLQAIIPSGARVLLVTMEYPQQDMQGPPFSVPETEVRHLFGQQFEIDLIHRNELGRDDPFAKRRGLSDMWENVYVLSRKAVGPGSQSRNEP